MTERDVKNALFARFKERRQQLIVKWRKYQGELDEERRQLVEAYGDLAADGLGDLQLGLAVARGLEAATSLATPAGQTRGKRRRRRR